MEIKLSMNLSKEDFEEMKDEEISKKAIKEELTQRFFEVCEDWVLRNEMPDLEFKN